MRLVSALLFVALTGSSALADEGKPSDFKAQVTKRKVPLRVVKLLPETGQVLLFDRHRGTHVVAEVGQDVDGYVVDEIVDDEVTLISPSGAEVILAAPHPTPPRRADRRARPGKPAQTAEPQPLDPYADAPSPSAASADAPSAEAPLAPGDGGVRVASASDKAPAAAPIVDAGAPALADPYADASPGIAAFAEAVGAVPPAPSATPGATPRVRSVAAPTPGKVSDSADAAAVLATAATGSPAAAPAAPAATAATSVTVTRVEVDAALADFGATAVTFDAGFVASGLRFDHIAAGTILAKLGLRAGDVLTAVDGKSLRSLDDAASLYARAGSARSATLSVLRGGSPMTLRVTIR